MAEVDQDLSLEELTMDAATRIVAVVRRIHQVYGVRINRIDLDDEGGVYMTHDDEPIEQRVGHFNQRTPMGTIH